MWVCTLHLCKWPPADPLFSGNRSPSFPVSLMEACAGRYRPGPGVWAGSPPLPRLLWRQAASSRCIPVLPTPPALLFCSGGRGGPTSPEPQGPSPASCAGNQQASAHVLAGPRIHSPPGPSSSVPLTGEGRPQAPPAQHPRFPMRTHEEAQAGRSLSSRWCALQQTHRSRRTASSICRDTALGSRVKQKQVPSARAGWESSRCGWWERKATRRLNPW